MDMKEVETKKCQTTELKENVYLNLSFCLSFLLERAAAVDGEGEGADEAANALALAGELDRFRLRVLLR